MIGSCPHDVQPASGAGARSSARIAGEFTSDAARMRLSQYPINTTKETPAEAEVLSHQLMLRAGLIRRVAAGIYSWLPLGLRVLRKVEHIVREEMDRAGGLEILMPAIQPAELWRESHPWAEDRPQLLRLQGRPEPPFFFWAT